MPRAVFVFISDPSNSSAIVMLPLRHNNGVRPAWRCAVLYWPLEGAGEWRFVARTLPSVILPQGSCLSNICSRVISTSSAGKACPLCVIVVVDGAVEHVMRVCHGDGHVPSYY